MTDALPMTDPDEQAAEWCLRLAEGALDADEQRAFDLWLSDEDNAAAFQDQAALWELTEVAGRTAEVVRMRSDALETYRRANKRRWSRPAHVPWRWTMTAAVAATLAITLVWLGFLRNPAESFRTDIGQRQVAMLDDGSRLTLDADSEVTVQMEDERRELSLERGRAKFDVAHDPLRPFVVSIGERRVIATGTAFSVERLARDVRIVLYEGRVAVVAPGVAVPLELRTPGSALTLPAAGSSPVGPQRVDVGRSLGWEHGQLDFEREPLASAVERMNRYARMPIEIAGAGTRNVQVTGVFDAGETEAFVEGVSTVYHLEVRREPDRIVLEQR